MSLEDIAPKLVSKSMRFFGDLRFCLVVLMEGGVGDIAQLVKCLLVPGPGSNTQHHLKLGVWYTSIIRTCTKKKI